MRGDGIPHLYNDSISAPVITLLSVPPVYARGLKLDDEAVRVAVGIRLGLDLRVPHQCRCDAPVDALDPVSRLPVTLPDHFGGNSYILSLHPSRERASRYLSHTR